MAIQPFAMQGQNANVMLPDEVRQLQAQADASQARNAMMQMDMRNQKALDQAYRESGGDINALAKNPNLGFQAGMDVRNLQAKQQANAADAEMANIDKALKITELGAQLFGSVQDQSGWQAAKQQFAGIVGPDAAANIPDSYDPALQKQMLDQSLSFRDKLMLQREQRMADAQQYDRQLDERRVAVMEAKAYAPSGGGDPHLPKAPANYRWAADGQSLEPIPGGPADPKTKTAASVTATEDERKAAGWFSQASLAQQQMREAMAEDPNASKKPFSEAVASSIPFVSEEAINATRNPARQRFTAAASSFAEAALRAATGAGINEMEAKQKIAELTPQYGDSEAAINDKLTRQTMYLESLKQRAGRAYNPPMAPASKTMTIQQLQKAANDKFGGDIDAARQAAQSHGYTINE